MSISPEYFVLPAEISFIIKNKTGVSNILPSLVDSLSLSCFCVADEYNVLASDGSVWLFSWILSKILSHGICYGVFYCWVTWEIFLVRYKLIVI
jgi:hypothetical protein